MAHVCLCQGVIAVHLSRVFQFHFELQACCVFLEMRQLSRKESNTLCRLRCFKQYPYVFTTGGLVSEAAHIFANSIVEKYPLSPRVQQAAPSSYNS